MYNNTIIIIIDIIMLMVVGILLFAISQNHYAISLLTLMMLSFFLLLYFNCPSRKFIGFLFIFPVLFQVRLTPGRLTPADQLFKVAVGSIHIYYKYGGLGHKWRGGLTYSKATI
jgi:hypothetical protein